ncbi:MAG: hypothetical protein J0G28_09440 [Afipia sp.]|mgnify:FL=1|nr:hypothetical protein [Afipia sp.]OJW61959.1 MAG: hypothetical protein BGO65_01320 [Afipia sp. 64-13]
MKTAFAAALVAAALMGVSTIGVSPASAMPLAPAAGTTNIIPVAQGCGPGFHRGPRGACRPNRGPIYAPVVRRCPPGFFVGPRGVCRRRY